MWHTGYMSGIMGYIWLVPMLFLVLVGFYVVSKKCGKSPKEILDERLARGEIDTVAYHEILKSMEIKNEKSLS